MDEAVEIGGFRQWLEEGFGQDISLFCKIFGVLSVESAPKTIKVIEKIVLFLKSNKLETSDALLHTDVQCDNCGGRAVLDDTVSTCPVCRGEGLIWVGPLANQNNLLNTISEMYLKIPQGQRYAEIKNWCKVE